MTMQDTQQYTNAALPLWRESLAGFDWLALRMSPAYLGIGVRRGQGQPVVLVPGFMASDNTLVELKCWLDRMGFRAYYSGIGRNVECPTSHVETIVEQVERAYAETGRRVTVVGHSLGGCLARGVAMRDGRRVARVISLGSPVEGARVHPWVFAASEHMHNDCDEACFLPLQGALPASVEEACLYSKTDGVVDPQTCRRSGGSTNIEVRGTHVGLIWNAQVYREIARLVAPPARRADRNAAPLHVRPRVLARAA